MLNILCLFEQSGTFKKILKSRGHCAIDCDIENRFGETDYQINIFAELTRPCFFDRYDLVFAFFPCTWFSRQNNLLISGNSYSMRNWSDEKKQAYIKNRLAERDRARKALERLVFYCTTQKVPLIVENPAGDYIKQILGEPNVKHMRSHYGDDYQKITYWYTYNCQINVDKMKVYKKGRYSQKHVEHEKHTSDKERQLLRSIISPVYAENLINAIELKGVELL